MKSKMKSAFAFIAVALMIMVAVVPMVSVFSDAAKVTVSDPEEVADAESADSTIITLGVKVYGGTGTEATSGFVKITYGSYSQIMEYDSGWTFKIYESTVSSVTINVTDKNGVVNSDYPAVTLNNLTKGNSYTATLAAGHIPATTTFKFANATGPMTKDILGGKTITASYSVFNAADATTAVETGKQFTMYYDSTSKELKGDFLYPASVSTPYLKVTSFSGVSGITFDTTGPAVDYSTGMTSIQELATISATALSENTAVINVDTFTLYYKSTPTDTTKPAEDKQVTYTALDNKMSATKNAYFIGTKPVDTTAATVSQFKYGLKMTADGGSYTMAAADAKDYSSGTAIAFSPATFGKSFYGQVYASATTYTQAGNVQAKIYKDTTNSFTISATVAADGYFFKFCDQTLDTTGGAMKEIKFGSYVIADTTYSGTSALTLQIAADKATNKYNELKPVAGYLKLAGATTSDDVAIAGKEITITGTGVTPFGSRVTGADGKFDFLATDGLNAILSVSGATLTGRISIVIGQDSSDVGTLYMSTQDATITLQDALGATVSDATVNLVDKDGVAIEMSKAFAYDAKKKAYTATVRGDVTLTSAFVYFTGGAHTFAANDVKTKVAYSSTTYKATTATYTLQMFDCNGGVIYDATASNVVTLYKATAYENSAKAIIYTYDNGDAGKITLAASKYPSTSAADNAYTFVASADVMKSQTLGAKPIDVIIANPAAAQLTSKIFSTYNILSSADGYVSLTAGTDSLKGTLTRLDGATPIAGITASLYINGSSTTGEADYTAVTQNDGSFEFISSVAFNDSGAKISKVKFTDPNGAYTFDDKAIFDTSKKKVTAFTSKTETYTMTFVDADGKAITDFDASKGPAITATKIVSGTETADNGTPLEIGEDGIVKYTAAWTSATSDLTIANIVAGKASFAKHTLTAAELASGEITIVSNQSTYKFTTVDADELKIGGITINVYGYNGDQPKTLAVVTGTTEADKTKATYGTASIRLPYYLDSVDSYYGYIAKDNTDSTQKYAFDTECTPILSTSITAESYYGKIVYFLAQSDGDALEFTGLDGTYSETKIFKDGSSDACATVTPAFGMVFFINDPTASYKVSVGDVQDKTGEVVNYTYTFKAKQAPVDGVLCAKEMWVIGDVVDAEGNSLGVAGTTEIGAYKTGTVAPVATAKYQAADKGNYYTMLVNVDDVDYFNVITEIAGYTFEDSITPVIVANEEIVYFTAYTANGIVLDPTGFTNAKAYDVTGAQIATALDNNKGVIVDTDKVAYYTATITGLAGYTFSESLTGAFVANEALLSGTVPYTGTAGVDQKVRLDLYLGDNLVGSVNADAVNGYDYTAKLDISGMVINGIAFDSIVAVYSENGIVIAESSVDPFTQVNNIVPIFVIEYDMELLVTKVTKGHIAADVQNNIAFLSADSVFYVADDESIYTDGQYKYTFVGWYVNGVLASTQPEFYYPLVGDSTASAQYDVEYIKTSDANKDVEKEYVNVIEEVEKQAPSQGIDTNVLIIGICAVVIALIAVVYAVIRKE